MVENHDFKIIKKKRKESKGKVSKFVGFNTTWASKIIEKQLDQTKKCPLMNRIFFVVWQHFGNLDEHDLEQTYALAAALLMLKRICSNLP